MLGAGPAMKLSLRARESIKTGLALAVTMAIALYMDFLQPQWAGFAVVMISLDSEGQSLNKAALRMAGTAAAFVASLTFMALFPQARWGMLLALTVYLGFCTYMMAGDKRPYAWYVAAFVCVTIMVHAGADSLNMFRFAVARLEETALGIGVYSLVSVFLWPTNSRAALETAARGLLDTQLRLLRAYRGLLAGEGSVADSRSLRLREVEALAGVGKALAAAEMDTYAVWELRFAWRRFVLGTRELAESLGRWRTTLPEIRALAPARLLPGLDAWLSELERRLERTERALAGDAADTGLEALDLAARPDALRALSHFDRAAIELFLSQLRTLDRVSRALLECVGDLRGAGRVALRRPETARASGLRLDPERVRAAVTVVATLWVGYGVWIWVDPPGHASFWYNSTLWAMVAVLSRQTVPSLVPAFLAAIVVGGVAYVLVMPHLTGYAELGLLLFTVTAASFYLLWEPRHRGARASFLALFLILTSIENAQSYRFASYANTSASSLLTLALAAAVGYFPSSPRPEKVFLRLLARFFRQAGFLMSELAPETERSRGPLARLRRAAYRTDLLALPDKLVALVDRIDYRLLPGTTRAQARLLVTNLLDLTLRIEELGEARRRVRSDPRLEEVVGELREWRLLAQQQFRLWTENPAAALDPGADLSARLHARLARMEDQLDRVRAGAGEGGPVVDYEKLYRYLGGFRGLSEAAIGYAAAAGSVDWEPWREARF